MKYLVILCIAVAVSCTSKSSVYTLDPGVPIVDYPTSYSDSKRMVDLQKALKAEEKATIFIKNNTVYSIQQFLEWTKKNTVQSLKFVQDKEKIAKMGYDSQTIKKVILFE